MSQDSDPGLKVLATKYSGLKIEDLRQRVLEAFPQVLNTNPITNAVVEGVADLSHKAREGAAFLDANKGRLGTSAAPPLVDQVREMFYGEPRGSAERYGARNLDVPRLGLEKAMGAQRDLEGSLQTLKGYLGLQFSEEDIRLALASKPEHNEPGDNGLYDKPFINETGDVRGVRVGNERLQLEIDGKNGPGRIFLRIEASTLADLIATTIGVAPTDSIPVNKTLGGW